MPNNHEAFIIIPGQASENLGRAVSDYLGSKALVLDSKPEKTIEHAQRILGSARSILTGKRVIAVVEIERSAQLPTIDQQLIQARRLKNIGADVILWSSLLPTEQALATDHTISQRDIQGFRYSVKRETFLPLLSLILQTLENTQGNQQ